MLQQSHSLPYVARTCSPLARYPNAAVGSNGEAAHTPLRDAAYVCSADALPVEMLPLGRSHEIHDTAVSDMRQGEIDRRLRRRTGDRNQGGIEMRVR